MVFSYQWLRPCLCSQALQLAQSHSALSGCSGRHHMAQWMNERGGSSHIHSSPSCTVCWPLSVWPWRCSKPTKSGYTLVDLKWVNFKLRLFYLRNYFNCLNYDDTASVSPKSLYEKNLQKSSIPTKMWHRISLINCLIHQKIRSSWEEVN